MKDELYEYFLEHLKDIWENLENTEENQKIFNKSVFIQDFLEIPNSVMYINGQIATINDINSFMWAIEQGMDIIQRMHMYITDGVWCLKVDTND